MRVLVGAVVALAFASSAFAQTDPAPVAPASGVTSQCAAVGPEPTFPDPATATAQSIQAADQAYRTWATAGQESLRCRQAELQPMQAQVNALSTEHNAIVNRVNAVTQSWTQISQAYCAREGVRCQRN